MCEVGTETNVQRLVWVIHVPEITVIGRPLFKLLLKMHSHVFYFETQCILRPDGA